MASDVGAVRLIRTNRPFRLLWSARAVLFLGDSLSLVALMLPDLARSLCWSQHQLFDQARPLPASAGKLAPQPLLNIPRQLIREGDGAHTMLEALFHAARHRTDTMINGRTVSLRHLTCAPDDHKTVCTLVWAALLADGTRALARAGRWNQAAERSAAHRGVGVVGQPAAFGLLDRGAQHVGGFFVAEIGQVDLWPAQLCTATRRAERGTAPARSSVSREDAIDVLVSEEQ